VTEMRDERFAAEIRIESAAGGRRSVQTASGTVFVKRGGWYLRYEENLDALGRSVNTVKIAPDGLKIIRRGAIESEMIFVVGRKTSGWLRTANFAAGLEVKCTEIRVDFHEGRGTVAWAYELSVDGTEPEFFRVKISVS